MKLSAPIYMLKQQAKVLARAEGIPLCHALDRIAHQEGFRAWSLLAARLPAKTPVETLFAALRPGELVLLGSRRGQGKTRLSLALAIQTMRHGQQAAFFTLDFTPTEVSHCFTALGEDMGTFHGQFLLDDSDTICAEYVISQLGSVPTKTLVIIDYLQLLDQRRENPDLMHQVEQLRSFARQRQVIVVCLSQIDRKFDPASHRGPGITDVRLPNPLDLSLFDKTCFLDQGSLEIR